MGGLEIWVWFTAGITVVGLTIVWTGAIGTTGLIVCVINDGLCCTVVCSTLVVPIVLATTFLFLKA